MFFIVIKNWFRVKFTTRFKLLFVFIQPNIKFIPIINYLNNIDIYGEKENIDEISYDTTDILSIEEIDIGEVLSDNKGKLKFNIFKLREFVGYIIHLLVLIRSKGISATVIFTLLTASFFGGSSALDVFKEKELVIKNLTKDKQHLEEVVKMHADTEKVLEQAILNSKDVIPDNIIKQIVSESLKYKNQKLILSIISTESKFDPFVIKKSNYGLCQIDYIKYKDKIKIESKKNLLDINTNIKYFNDIVLLENENDLKKFLLSYTKDPKLAQNIIESYINLDFFIKK